MSQQKSQCLGSGYVDVLGVEKLQSAGIAPDALAEGSSLDDLSIDDDTAKALFDQFAACQIDPKDIYISFAELFLDGPLTPEQRTCLDGVLTEDNLRRSFVADATGAELDPDPLDADDDCAPLSLDRPESQTVPTIATSPGN